MVGFADEPTGNLESQSGREIIGLLLELRDSGDLKAVVIATHDQAGAGHARPRVILRDGPVVEDTGRDII